jgi:hypothetical protein
LAILAANAMMGELTPRMAEALSSSPAVKVLIPLTQEKVRIVGVSGEPLPHMVDKLVQVIEKHVSEG